MPAFPCLRGRAGRTGQGRGFALKLHQRAWASRHGIALISCTFDPLVRRNAYFNLTKLAARAVDYLPDFYGPMADVMNTGDPSDRLFVNWNLNAGKVLAASEGSPLVPAEPGADITVVVLDSSTDGAPELRWATGARLACRTPRDISGLRAERPALARRWRLALREVLTAALRDGYVITGATREGYYLLEHG